LTQSLAALRQPVGPPLVQPADELADDGSIHDNTNLLGPNGCGRVLGQQGWLPPFLGVRRVIPAEDYFELTNYVFRSRLCICSYCRNHMLEV
jgi:hypothetical protein